MKYVVYFLIGLGVASTTPKTMDKSDRLIVVFLWPAIVANNAVYYLEANQ